MFCFSFLPIIDLGASSIKSRDTWDGSSPCDVWNTHMLRKEVLSQELYVKDVSLDHPPTTRSGAGYRFAQTCPVHTIRGKTRDVTEVLYRGAFRPSSLSYFEIFAHLTAGTTHQWFPKIGCATGCGGMVCMCAFGLSMRTASVRNSSATSAEVVTVYRFFARESAGPMREPTGELLTRGKIPRRRRFPREPVRP